MTVDYRIDIDKLFSHYPFVKEILDRLTEAGHEAVLVGGVVRDGLLAQFDPGAVYPPKEVDIATSALPDEIRQLFPDRQIVGVGEEFGVLIIVTPDGHKVEVATFRVEAEYDGRWPGKVRLVRALEDDVKRRDLTINGLAATKDGTVIDFVGGMEDLKIRCIRAIGDPRIRFAEDYLRMLRTVRFACQLHGEIEPNTAAAIQENAGKIQSISRERIREELFRLLKTDRAARGIVLLDGFCLLDSILPEVGTMKGVPQPEAYHPEGDVYVHTLATVQIADAYIHDPVVKLAVFLHDIGKPYALARSGGANMGGHCAIGARMAKTIGQRLRLSRQDISRLCFLIKDHMRIANFPEMGRGKQVRLLSGGEIPEAETLQERFPQFFELLQVLVADSEASAHRSSGWRPILQETMRVIEHIDQVCGLKRARQLVDGHALLEMGMQPGPELGKILETIHDRILAGEITTREEALAEARILLSQQDQGK